MGLKHRFLRLILNTLHFSAAGKLTSGLTRGLGVIFTLHRVTREPSGDFDPNRILNVTPQFLRDTLETFRAMKLDILSLDEVAERVQSDHARKPFVCFTLDDGYRDTFHEAYPVFRAYDAPFAVYLASAFPKGTLTLWWLVLRDIINESDFIEPEIAGLPDRISTRVPSEKEKSFQILWSWLLFEASHEERERCISRLALKARYDVPALCRELSMSWDEICRLAQDPLATLGGHTVSHPNLRTLGRNQAKTEIEQGLADIEHYTGCRPVHFSYPYGMPGAAGKEEFNLLSELGLKTAVTTRPGMIWPEHRSHMLALPRMSLNGLYQEQRYVRLLQSGLPAILANKGRRLNVG